MRAFVVWLCLCASLHAAGLAPREPVRRSFAPGRYALFIDDHVFGRRAIVFHVAKTPTGIELLEDCNKVFPIMMAGPHTLAGVDFQYGGFCDCCPPIVFTGTLRRNDWIEGTYLGPLQETPGKFSLRRLPD